MKRYSYPLVSIITPVYNAQKTLDKTLSSLYNQTYSPIEFVFVNDSSNDGSLQLLEKFEYQINNERLNDYCRIITHTENCGVATARNTGLNNSNGEYVYYVDADDEIESHAIEYLIHAALDNNSDIVGCNWYLKFNSNHRAMIQPKSTSGFEAIEKMAKGVLRWNLWLFLVKRSLYEEYNIRFLENKNMGEDMMVMFKLFYLANKIYMIDQCLYFYGQSNNESLTKVYSEKHKLEVSDNLNEINSYFNNSKYKKEWSVLSNYLKLNIKLPLLISNDVKNYEIWRNWFNESNSYIFRNEITSKRIKLLQYMALRGQDWYVKLHYYLIVKVVYGIIYK